MWQRRLPLQVKTQFMMSGMVKREILPELLNELAPDRARGSLRDMVRLNRHFGGHRILRRILRREGGHPFTLLDVGAASGDMGATLQRAFPGAAVTCLDQCPAHLREARHPKLAADAFALPFGDGSFDYVFSSLFLHHFTDDDVVRLLAGFKRIARKGVIAIDLERNFFAYHFLAATNWIFDWDRITLHDGPVSVQAGFRRTELLALADRAGLARAAVRGNAPWFRLSLVAPL